MSHPFLLPAATSHPRDPTRSDPFPSLVFNTRPTHALLLALEASLPTSGPCSRAPPASNASSSSLPPRRIHQDRPRPAPLLPLLSLSSSFSLSHFSISLCFEQSTPRPRTPSLAPRSACLEPPKVFLLVDAAPASSTRTPPPWPQLPARLRPRPRQDPPGPHRRAKSPASSRRPTAKFCRCRCKSHAAAALLPVEQRRTAPMPRAVRAHAALVA